MPRGIGTDLTSMLNNDRFLNMYQRYFGGGTYTPTRYASEYVGYFDDIPNSLALAKNRLACGVADHASRRTSLGSRQKLTITSNQKAFITGQMEEYVTEFDELPTYGWITTITARKVHSNKTLKTVKPKTYPKLNPYKQHMFKDLGSQYHKNQHRRNYAYK